MNELAFEQLPSLLVINEGLPRRISRYINEKPVTQEGFLNRNQWQTELNINMQRGTSLVVVVDMIGAGRLGETFPARMQEIINGLNDWKNYYAPDHKLAGTHGRKIEVQERLPGEDEIVFFICPKPEENSVEILTQLNHSIKSATGVEAVYIGASENPIGSDVSTALRAADIALKRIKQEIKRLPEKQKSYNPGVILIQNNQATYDGSVIDPKELKITIPNYPNNVVLENVIEQLRHIKGNLALFSPQEMKEINIQLGMKGGDQVLVDLTSKINGILEAKGLPGVKIFKIGTIFVVPNVDFTQDDLNAISGLLPYGLYYNNLSQ